MDAEGFFLKMSRKRSGARHSGGTSGIQIDQLTAILIGFERVERMDGGWMTLQCVHSGMSLQNCSFFDFMVLPPSCFECLPLFTFLAYRKKKGFKKCSPSRGEKSITETGKRRVIKIQTKTAIRTCWPLDHKVYTATKI